MDTVTTKRTPAKTRTRNFFDHRSILQASHIHNIAEYKQLPTQPRRTMHGTPRYGDNVIADLNTSGEVVRSYVTPGLDSNVSMTIHDATTTTYYYNQDERQSVMNLTNSTGVVAQSYAYSAYGDRIDSLRSHVSSLIPNRYTYTGRELSENSGDYYFRYRWYGASVGGFMSRDPAGYADGMGLYSGYFSMWLAIDPNGLRCCCCPKDLKFTHTNWYPKGGDSYEGYVEWQKKIDRPVLSKEDWLRTIVGQVDGQGSTMGYYMNISGKVRYEKLDNKEGLIDCAYDNYEQVNQSKVWDKGMGVFKKNVWQKMNTTWNIFPLDIKIAPGVEATFNDEDSPRALTKNIGKGKKLIVQFINILRNTDPDKCKDVCGNVTEIKLCAELVFAVDKTGKADFANSSFREVPNCKGFSEWPGRIKKQP